ncbi:MAG: choice-of-anchor D domain-containing protein [Betaproteobacteria bacterium]|nr:choice-of-anchor D domain-containing protein [Betaproteobacteria bacterium]
MQCGGTYTYRTLVDLTGFDPATAVIQGKWAVDNQGTAIRLNGTSIGATQPGYNPFQTFTINSGFIAGVNTLDFVTADQGCPNGLRVELSGTATISTGGGTPTFSPGATTLTFASQAVSTTSAAQTLTITNTGTSTLTIATPVISGPFAIGANSCASVVPSGNCAISVTFTPVATGAATGTLTIPSNAAGSPHAISLTGTGAAAPSGSFAYITSQNSNNVSVIDTSTDTVVATIAVGSPSYGVAVNPGGTRVYVTHPGNDSVSVIDTSSNTVIAPVSVGTSPNGIAVSPDGTRVYVANSSNSVSVIETVGNTVIATLTVGTNPFGIAVTPDGTRVYVSNKGSNNVSVIDATNNTVLPILLGVGSNPMGVAINASGTRVFVANGGGGISIINTANNFLLAHLAFGVAPVGVAVHPNGTRVYLVDASGSNGTVRVIDPVNYTESPPIAVGQQPVGIAVNADGTHLYVANRLDNNVAVIDTSTNTVLHNVPIGSQPNGFGIFIGSPAAAVPGAPTIGTATSGNGQVTINFTAPANNGGSAITGYTATCSSIAAITRTATALTSPITVTNLTNFVGYNCSVTAANSAGTGPASATVTVLPIGAPGIVSSGTANGVVNTPFSYQILTNAVASSYGVSGALPSGVTLDTVTGVISGTPTQSGTFNVTLSATNGGGTGTLPLSITIAANAVTFIEAVSRKTHGIAGSYELVLDSGQFVTGNVTVEPRFMGAGHQIVFKFDGPINNEGFLTVTDSTGASITTGTHARLGNEVIVTLTGNLNARRVAVTLLGVNGSVNVGTVLGFLLGDVNNSRNVNAQDTSRIKARAGQLANASNFLHDISVSGRITAVDVIVSKVLNGTVLP